MNGYAFYEAYTEGLQKQGKAEWFAEEGLGKVSPPDAPQGGPGPLGGRTSVHGRGVPGLRHQIKLPDKPINLPSFLSEAYPGASLAEIWDNLPLSSKLLIVTGGAAAGTAGALKGYDVLQQKYPKLFLSRDETETGQAIADLKARLARA